MAPLWWPRTVAFSARRATRGARMDEGTPVEVDHAGLSRRTILARAGIVAGAVWAAPVVTSWGATAMAGSAPGPGPGTCNCDSEACPENGLSECGDGCGCV